MDEALLRIGEVAAFFGVSVKTIRLYDKYGIVRPAKVDAASGYRYYTAEQVGQLGALFDLKRLGFSLREIKALLAGGLNNNAFLEALAHKRMAWLEAAAASENKAANIEGIIQRVHASKPALKIHEMSEQERALLLVKLVCVEDISVQSALCEALWV